LIIYKRGLDWYVDPVLEWPAVFRISPTVCRGYAVTRAALRPGCYVAVVPASWVREGYQPSTPEPVASPDGYLVHWFWIGREECDSRVIAFRDERDEKVILGYLR